MFCTKCGKEAGDVGFCPECGAALGTSKTENTNGMAKTTVHLPYGLWFLFNMVNRLISLAGFVLWVLLIVKAYQGKYYKLPIIGDIAESKRCVSFAAPYPGKVVP